MADYYYKQLTNGALIKKVNEKDEFGSFRVRSYPTIITSNMLNVASSYLQILIYQPSGDHNTVPWNPKEG